MPELYTIFARKILFARIWGGGLSPVSYAYGQSHYDTGQVVHIQYKN